MRTIITTDYGESSALFGKFWGDSGSDCHYAFGADAVGGPRKQGLTSRERSGHPKHGLAFACCCGSLSFILRSERFFGLSAALGQIPAPRHQTRRSAATAAFC